MLGQQGTVPLGPEEQLLASNSTNAGLQNIGPDEAVRITVFREPATSAFDLWAVQMSMYAGTGALAATVSGNCPGLSVSAAAPATPYTWATASWVDAGAYYLGILVQGNGSAPAEAQDLLRSFRPEGCGP